MINTSETALLPLNYETYVFDLYGTLVDINTDEENIEVWEKLSIFYGYYKALYKALELKNSYKKIIKKKEANLKSTLEQDPKYAHEASPEIELTEVFQELYLKKGIDVDNSLAVYTGQLFRILTTKYLKLYDGTIEMLNKLKKEGKKIYLLSNAQRIFTEYEMNLLGITKFFDGILISSDYLTKKPDKRFFDILIDKYTINPTNTLFIGNDSKTDILGAKSVGFSTYYVKSNISPQGDMALDADYIVDDFKKWTI